MKTNRYFVFQSTNPHKFWTLFLPVGQYLNTVCRKFKQNAIFSESDEFCNKSFVALIIKFDWRTNTIKFDLFFKYKSYSGYSNFSIDFSRLFCCICWCRFVFLLIRVLAPIHLHPHSLTESVNGWSGNRKHTPWHDAFTDNTNRKLSWQIFSEIFYRDIW